MNANNFSEYIKNPSQLYQISYQELKSLVLQYPYAINLRYLLLKKSYLENHRDFERNLQAAAAYSIDRTTLFKQLKESEKIEQTTEHYLMSEDFLELKDLTSLEQALEKEPLPESAPQQELSSMLFNLEDIPSASPSVDASIFIEDDEEETVNLLEQILEEEVVILSPENIVEEDSVEFLLNIEDEEEKVIEEQLPETLEESSVVLLIDEVVEPVLPEPVVIKPILNQEDIDRLATAMTILEELPLFDNPVIEEIIPEKPETSFEITKEEILPASPKETTFEPLPKSSFNSWLQQFEGPKVDNGLDNVVQLSPKKEKNGKSKALNMSLNKLKVKDSEVKKIKKKEKKVLQLAKLSILEDEEVSSETLARLLESQGYYEKAINMYQRLSLLNPQKSDFFAAKIKELKKRI